MKLKEIESALCKLTQFQTPRIDLEQYPTSAHITTQLIHTLHTHNDLLQKQVIDLGCGAGTLSIGCALGGAAFIHSYDIDANALALAQRNVEKIGVEDRVDLVQTDVTRGVEGKVDVVVMNAPFGTRRRGVDMMFLNVGMGLVWGCGVVYTMHKRTTRGYVGRCVKAVGCDAEVC